jgi:hypothetical protein
LAVAREDAKGVERSCPCRPDDLDPFLPAEFCEACPDRGEVPQAESGEVRGVPVPDVGAVEVGLTGIDAAPLPVGHDSAGRPVQRARRTPPAGQVIKCRRAAHGAVLEGASFDGDGAVADRVGHRFAKGERYPPVQPFELGQHRVSWCPLRCGVRLDRAESPQRGLQRVGLVPEQCHVEVGPVPEVELELASSLAAGQHPSHRAVRVASVGKAGGEVARPALVDLELHVDVDIMRLKCAAGEGSEDVQTSHKADWPLIPTLVKCLQDLLQEQFRAFPLHDASVVGAASANDEFTEQMPLCGLVRQPRSAGQSRTSRQGLVEEWLSPPPVRRDWHILAAQRRSAVVTDGAL